MSLSPKKLRDSLAATVASGGRCLAIDCADAPMLIDAMEIADSCARSDIESFCSQADGWYDIEGVREDEREMIDKSLRYLDARGKIEYRTVNGRRQVRFKEGA